MNTTTATARTASSKAIETVGNFAAYGFWITASLICLGFVAVAFSYDSPFSFIVGQIFAGVATAMLLSIGVMAACAKLLKLRGEY